MAAVLAHRPTSFVGEGDILVDRLIAASTVTKLATNPHPGFGRELQPFFDSFTDVPTRPRPSTGETKQNSATKKDANQRRFKKSRSQSPKGNKAGLESGLPGNRPAQWAGPGYVVSPKPDALPMPPVSLLRRA